MKPDAQNLTTRQVVINAIKISASPVRAQTATNAPAARPSTARSALLNVQSVNIFCAQHVQNDAINARR